MSIGIEQLRANRRHALNAWLVGGDGNRWEGDDGRVLKMSEWQFWPEIVRNAEAVFFATLDAQYEAEKASL